MSQNNSYDDLCMTCIHASTCERKKKSALSTWQCEEFDDYVKQPMRAVEIKQDSSELKEIVEGRELGLCINCEFRKTCSHPKLEGGIWHCEDYK